LEQGETVELVLPHQEHKVVALALVAQFMFITK
jgi:hypothetical protein